MVSKHLTLFFLAGKKSTGVYVGIEGSKVIARLDNPSKQGMTARVALRPISSKTPLGRARQYPYGPYCTLNHGGNPKIAKVT